MDLKVNKHDGLGDVLLTEVEDYHDIVIGENRIGACFLSMLKDEAAKNTTLSLSLTKNGDILFKTVYDYKPEQE